MFHFISKILLVFLSPLVWSVVFIGLGIILPTRQWSKKIILAGLILLLVMSNPILFKGIAYLWEPALQRQETMPNDVEAIVILGGMAVWEETSKHVVFTQANDRLMQALELFQHQKTPRLVITGGSGTPFQELKSEAIILRDYLIRQGFSSDQVFAESEAKNTYQNAVLTARLFEQHHWNKRIILITSAFHIKRAVKCFEKQGFQTISYPAHPLNEIKPLTPADFLVPDAQTLKNWDYLIKEWIGLITYRLMGYI